MPRAPADLASAAPSGAAALDHVLRAMRSQYAAIRVHEPGVRAGADPEELHQMRVAVRRLRAILRAVRPLFAAGPLTDLRRELRWLGSALGAARDADVFHAYMRAEIASLRPDERGPGERLLARLDVGRAGARARAVAALDDARYARLMERVEELVRHPGRVVGEVSLPDLARQDFKRLRKAVAALPKKPSDDALHAVRIKVKRARFTAELAGAVAGRPAERFAARAHRVQDILGEHQDAVVAEQRLRDVLEDLDDAEAAAAERLLRRQRRRRKMALAAFRDGWPRLERRGQKAWTRA
jgi:CHAD domain-containing protein